MYKFNLLSFIALFLAVFGINLLAVTSGVGVLAGFVVGMIVAFLWPIIYKPIIERISDE